MTSSSSHRPSLDLPGAETERLIAELRARGIMYLSGGYDPHVVAEVAAHPLSDAELLLRLADCVESRVRSATIALVLLHPRLADVAVEMARAADAEMAERLATLLLAALYLLHLWRTRLRLALGREPMLPEGQLAELWQSRDLPDPALFYGELGLRALEKVEQQRRGVPFRFRGDWEDQVLRLMKQEWRERQREREVG